MLTVTDRVVRYLLKIDDPTQRAVLAQELLGRSWMSIVDDYLRRTN